MLRLERWEIFDYYELVAHIKSPFAPIILWELFCTLYINVLKEQFYENCKRIVGFERRCLCLYSGQERCKAFLKNAEAEGFVFSGNRRPSKAKTSSLFSLKRNFEISYVGSFGYMAFRHPEYENMVTFIRDFDDGKSECKLVRVDYAAYLRGADDYIITQISV